MDLVVMTSDRAEWRSCHNLRHHWPGQYLDDPPELISYIYFTDSHYYSQNHQNR